MWLLIKSSANLLLANKPTKANLLVILMCVQYNTWAKAMSFYESELHISRGNEVQKGHNHEVCHMVSVNW